MVEDFIILRLMNEEATLYESISLPAENITRKLTSIEDRRHTDRVRTLRPLVLYCGHAYCRSSRAAFPMVSGSRDTVVDQYSARCSTGI